MTDNSKGIETFNPKNLPLTKRGICSHEDHESWTGDEAIEEDLQLMMYYSDEFNTKNETTDKIKMSSEELDKFMEEIEKIKWEPNSEQYWCEACMECLF